jgi:hypothetical protein
MDTVKKDDFVIGLYWGARKENLDECIDKVSNTFLKLKEIHASMQEWYLTTKPKKGHLVVPIDLSLEGIKSLLLRGRSFRDDGSLDEDLGYLVYLKSIKDFSKAHVLSIKCGSTSELIPNSVVLTISKYEGYDYMTKDELLKTIYSRLKDIWKPDKGILFRNEHEISLDSI